MSLHNTVLASAYNKPEVTLMHSSNHAKHYIKYLYYLTRTKHDCTSAQRIFNWNISVVSGHKRGTVAFNQRKPLSRSTTNSALNNCTNVHCCHDKINIQNSTFVIGLMWCVNVVSRSLAI